MTVADIGPNSNRRQVALAVSALQDDANLVASGDLADRLEALETSVDTADTGLLDRMDAAEADILTAQGAADTAQAAVDAVELNQKIVAGPQTLSETTFLTAQLLRKVLTVAAGPNASTVNTAHGITTPSKIIGCVIQLTNGTNHLCFSQGGMLSDTIAHSIIVTIDGTNVGMTSGAGGDYSLYAGSIILVYVD